MADPGKSYEEAQLLYFFWLPSGKDEFGYRGYHDAPLSPTTFYRHQFERTITEHLRAQEKRLRGNDASLAGLTWRGDLEPKDAELALRKIEFSFQYEPDRSHLPTFLPVEPLQGTAFIMSNGLYLWAFKIKYECGTPEDVVKESLNDFLREDFVQHHIDRMFGFGWPNARLDEAQSSYTGVLTYYQLDLLFNCVFDASAHPHLFLQGDRPLEQAPTGSDMYSVGSIVRSLSLACFRRNYEPLWDLRKNYSFRGPLTNGEKVYLDTDVDLFQQPVNGRYDEERERLLSRLSFAAMEQFLRIAVPFGVTHYRAGLDHCRSELVNYSLVARRNQSSTELRRPSLQRASITLSEIEAYHALLAGKVPSLEFFHGLVESLAVVSEPLRAPDEANATDSWVEWVFGRSTLGEALAGFKRYIDVIKTELLVIDNSLAITRTDTMLSELADTRKLAELQAESVTASEAQKQDGQTTVTLEGSTWDKLSFRLGVFAIVLGFFEIYSNFGVWLTEGLFKHEVLPQSTPFWYKFWGFAYWVPLLTALLVVAFFIRKHYFSPTAVADSTQRDQPEPEPVRRFETHVFDYSFIREVVDSRGLSDNVVSNLKTAMIDLQDIEQHVKAVSYSTFREMPISGTERIKYSLESEANPQGVSYLLHIEVDRRKAIVGTNGSGDVATHTELLRNVRLVARVPRDVIFDVSQGSRGVVANCIRSLVLANRSDHEVRSFFETHFGWEVGPGPSALTVT